MKTILGIDPGSRVTGYGIIESNLIKSRYLASGCIRVRSTDFAERLADIFSGISQLILEYSPHEIAIEKVFMAKNPASALKLGQARGAAIVAGVAKGLSFAEYSAREVKQAIVGTGAADKTQVQHMIMSLLGLNAKPQADAADALAIALCHVHHQQTHFRMAQRLKPSADAGFALIA